MASSLTSGPESIKSEFSGVKKAAFGINSDVNLKSAIQMAAEVTNKNSDLIQRPVSFNSRRVHPLVTLNPYQNNWTVKVRVTSKSPLRTYTNSRGPSMVLKVEFMDDEGTSIEATMWREAAEKFSDVFQLGKAYFVSKGTLKMANKQYSLVENDYEMNLNINSVVEEIKEDEAEADKKILIKYNFIKMNDLGPYVGERKLIDIVGVVQQVSEVLTIRRKSNGEEIPKRELTLADESLKTVVVTLWGDLATEDGSNLSRNGGNGAFVLALKHLRVGDYQGVSLSSTSRTTLEVNPTIPETEKLMNWYESEGKVSSLVPAGQGMVGSGAKAAVSMYEDRVFFNDISDSTGSGKAEFFNTRLTVSMIKPDQHMYYNACQKCNRKVTEDQSSGFWCESCGQKFDSCNKRYIVSMKVMDSTGESWITAFNEQAEYLLGITAEKLAVLRETDEVKYKARLREATWKSHLVRMGVEVSEYKGEKRQRFRVRTATPVNWVQESKYLIEQIEAMKG